MTILDNSIYQARCCQDCSINTFVIIYQTNSSFSSKSSEHLHAQTVRAMDLTFQKMFTSHNWSTTGQMSSVRCHVYTVMY